VARVTTLRILLTVAGHYKMTVKHYDIQTAFSHGELSQDVYMQQPLVVIMNMEHGDNLSVSSTKAYMA